MQSNGSDLPNWIRFTPENRLVYGTAKTNLSSIALRLYASDPKRAAITTSFTLNIVRNKPPLVLNEIGNINIYMNSYFEYQVPESIFRDEDGDELIYWIESFDNFN